ncbi:GDSL esterase/lipase, partial [Cucurbita argyrosperma subsp. sororia]
MKGQSLVVLCLLTIACFASNWVDGASSSRIKSRTKSRTKSKPKSISTTQTKTKVGCYFVLGDSQADNGNNNVMEMAYGNARADYKPYGCDFNREGTPTGRFTNGRNTPDFIATYLGFRHYISPFTTIKGREILDGVNYASGGAGILPETGRTLGKVLSIHKQLVNHNITISRIRGLLGTRSATSTHLSSCLYTVQIGSNDYLNNYFMPKFYKTSAQYTPQQFATVLNNQLYTELKVLYEQGARKVAVFGVGSIGCTPYARANFENKGGGCVDKINNAIQLFNDGLKALVRQFNTKMAGAKFTYIDVFKISSTSPATSGRMVLNAPCCEVDAGQVQCTRLGRICANRMEYMFWDAVHPTEVGISALASRAFKAKEAGDAYPYDINQLVHLPK